MDDNYRDRGTKSFQVTPQFFFQVINVYNSMLVLIFNNICAGRDLRNSSQSLSVHTFPVCVCK